MGNIQKGRKVEIVSSGDTGFDNTIKKFFPTKASKQATSNWPLGDLPPVEPRPYPIVRLKAPVASPHK